MSVRIIHKDFCSEICSPMLLVCVIDDCLLYKDNNWNKEFNPMHLNSLWVSFEIFLYLFLLLQIFIIIWLSCFLNYNLKIFEP